MFFVFFYRGSQVAIRTIRVLLIEDDCDDAFLTRNALAQIAQPAFHVDHVHTLTEAADRMGAAAYDVALLDLGLREAAGIETLARFREMGGEALPVVVLTGNSDERAAYQTLDEGAQDHLVKGDIRPDTLARSIQYAIRRQQLLDQLQAANELLERKNQHLADLYDTAQQFVDNVSHEFRTPLTVIREFTSIIRDGLDGPVTAKQVEHLDKVLRRTDDLALMVDDMLDISKLEAGLLGVWRRPYCTCDLINNVVGLLNGRAKSKQIELDARIDGDLPEVFCDQEKTQRVLINLVVNAIKFTPDGGRVEIWAQVAANGQEVVVGVTDTGPGISKENLDTIFERFQQVGGNIRSSTKGFGLGLNIARELVGLNLGQMHVESELGQGSTFSFTVPRDDSVIVLQRFLDRTESIADADDPISLIVARPTSHDHAKPVVDEFLQRAVRGQDLAIRVADDCWVLLTPCPEIEVGRLIGRIGSEWNETIRNSPIWDLPAIALEHRGVWRMPAGRDELMNEVRSLIDVTDASVEAVGNAERPPQERKVLVVDDDREVNLCLGVRLRAAGYDVVSAYDGEEGLMAAIEQRPDAVVLDIRMPKKDGMTVLHELRTHEVTKNTPIVMLSASIRDQHRALEEGANFFLPKPFDAKSVLSAIESSISNGSSL